MPAVTRRVVLHVPAEHAFDVITDMRRHAAWVPATRVDAPPAPLAEGEEFVAVTGPTARTGGPGLVDRMRLTHRVAPSTAQRTAGWAHVVKLGPVLTGWARITVRPLGAAACEVAWTEQIGLRGVPDALTGLVARPATAAMLSLVLRQVARDTAAT